MKVVAVVVTYNRRELLQKTLVGLESQERPVDHILVIDNASTDGTDAMLAERTPGAPTTIERMSENTGGAGGFARGTELAFELGADAIWLMDDDTVPQPGSLGPLVSALEDAEERLGAMPSFACSLVLWHDGSLCEMNTPVPTWDWPRPLTMGADYTLSSSCSFVSVLVTREAVRTVGLPSPNFFIWFDDAEYTLRLSKFRPGIFVPASTVNHLLPQNRGVNFGDVNDSNLWKFEYGVRNQVGSALAMRSPVMMASLVENSLKQLYRSGVPWKLRLKLAKSAVKGLRFRPSITFPRTVE